MILLDLTVQVTDLFIQTFYILFSRRNIFICLYNCIIRISFCTLFHTWNYKKTYNCNTDRSSNQKVYNRNQRASLSKFTRTYDQISDLNSQIEQYKTDSANVEQKISSYENLLTAYISYAGKDYEAASTSLESVQENNLSDNAKTIYNQVFNSVKDEVLGKKYTDAMKKYLAKDYDTAINEFTEIIQMDENYNDGKAIYYLAHSYYQKKDGTNAMVWFQMNIFT